MSKSGLLLAPEPKQVSTVGGRLELPEKGYIVLAGKDISRLFGSARKLKGVLAGDWKITAGAPDPDDVVITLTCDADADSQAQGYKLDITPSGACVKASTPAGVYYGVCTLTQLLVRDRAGLPVVSIVDWPDFPTRGVMMDISRDKVPSMDTLRALIDRLSEWKINHLELYTEHTFAYLHHETVWKDASPMTAEEIMELDAYCAERFIELVPNQNSFGHMERWLKHEEYIHLAEAPDGADLPWGGRMDHPFGLCPTDPGSIELVAGLFDELLPHFTSKMVNVGCDETFDLGQGRSKELCEKEGIGNVYLEFLLKIHELVRSRGHKMLFWGDIIMHHPELIPKLPSDVIALEWGYEANHPFEADGRRFAESGIEYWVCPGTSSWCTISGRTDNCIENLRNAAVNGKAGGATGFLNTDWGDHGHWQCLPVSYLGYLYGASVSWNADQTDAASLPDALSAFAFGDAANVMGRIAYDLGNLYELIKRKTGNSSIIWRQLTKPLDDVGFVDDTSVEEFEAAQAAAERALVDLNAAQMNTPDAALVRDEFAHLAKMNILGCQFAITRLKLKAGQDISADKPRLRNALQSVIAEHERLWLARNRPGGLIDSKKKLEDRFADL